MTTLDRQYKQDNNTTGQQYKQDNNTNSTTELELILRGVLDMAHDYGQWR